MIRSSRNLLTILLLCAAFPAIRVNAAEVVAYFSPNGGTAVAIAAEIDKAKASVDVAAYQLTNRTLAQALADAAQRGCIVRVTLDKGQEANGSPYPKHLQAKGVQVRTDAAEKIQHNKYCIIDSAVTVTGSYNWSDNAEKRNAENAVIIRDPSTARQFAEDFKTHWDHSRAYTVRDFPSKKPASPASLYPSQAKRPRVKEPQ